MESDCAVCHSNEGDSLSASGFLASQHQGDDCTSCHTDSDGLRGAHAEVNRGIRLRPRPRLIPSRHPIPSRPRRWRRCVTMVGRKEGTCRHTSSSSRTTKTSPT
jgi:hypothetical protein